MRVMIINVLNWNKTILNHSVEVLNTSSLYVYVATYNVYIYLTVLYCILGHAYT